VSFKPSWPGAVQRPYARDSGGPRAASKGLVELDTGSERLARFGNKFRGQVGTLIYRAKPPPPVRYALQGVTRDSAGVILGSCTVNIFRTSDNSWAGSTVSDATTGAWTFDVIGGSPFFLYEYKTGSPDRAGASVNTLVATAI
jgi:hypothetical protein